MSIVVSCVCSNKKVVSAPYMKCLLEKTLIQNLWKWNADIRAQLDNIFIFYRTYWLCKEALLKQIWDVSLSETSLCNTQMKFVLLTIGTTSAAMLLFFFQRNPLVILLLYYNYIYMIIVFYRMFCLLTCLILHSKYLKFIKY